MHVPAGWYPDPENYASLRWWDGKQWTPHTSAPRFIKPPHRAKPRLAIASAVLAGITIIIGFSFELSYLIVLPLVGTMVCAVLSMIKREAFRPLSVTTLVISPFLLVALIVVALISPMPSSDYSIRTAELQEDSDNLTVQIVPDVQGVPLSEARQKIIEIDAKPELDEAEAWSTILSARDSDDVMTLASKYSVVSSSPQAGEEVEAGTAVTLMIEYKIPAKFKDAEWVAICQTGAVYQLVDLAKGEYQTCSFAKTPGHDFHPTAKQRIAMDYFGTGELEDFSSLEPALDKCLAWDAETGFVSEKGTRILLDLCPDGPMASDMSNFINKRLFADGSFVVGDDVKPGTYRSSQKRHDCYWERASGSGETLANDFITFTAKGALVRLNNGESFTSKRCGTWRPA